MTNKRKSSCVTARGHTAQGVGYPSPVLARGYPSPVLAGGTPVKGYPLVRTGVPPQPGWGTPQQGLEYLQKGPGTRDLGKNMGLGYPPPV